MLSRILFFDKKWGLETLRFLTEGSLSPDCDFSESRILSKNFNFLWTEETAICLSFMALRNNLSLDLNLVRFLLWELMIDSLDSDFRSFKIFYFFNIFSLSIFSFSNSISFYYEPGLEPEPEPKPKLVSLEFNPILLLFFWWLPSAKEVVELFIFEFTVLLEH